jgi:hypothetical protein
MRQDMATKPREKLNFDLGQAQPAPQSPPPVQPPKPKATPKIVEAMPRKAVATRLPTDLYRQAKARAALDDVTIQAVIESALRAYVANAGTSAGAKAAAA